MDMSNHTNTTTRRIGAGVYEIDTPIGTFEVSKSEFDYGTIVTVWSIYWPGQSRPDAQTDTLRYAKEIVAEVVAEAVAS